MKFLIGIFLLLISLNVYSQESDNTNWFLLEGVSNAQYKVYLDTANINYTPGVTINAKLKYQYKDDSIIDYITRDVEFSVSENTYRIINQAHFLKQGSIDVEPVTQTRHLVPGSEMSVIYQSVYIQAVSKGPTK